MILNQFISLISKRVAILILSLILSSATFSQNKIALVIGNSSYQNAELRNPINDATDFAVKLITLDFTVTLKKDLNQDQFEEAVRDFTASIENRDVVLFYYSGHGMQAYGKNYLIPIGERIEAEDEIKHKSFSLDFLLDKLSYSESATNIIILDACRDNPFSGFRSLTKGFAQVYAPSGTIISYSTGPGRIAYDGDGRNSPYTESLLECIDSPNQQIEAFFKEVRRKVEEKTKEKQTPWENSSLINDFFFNPVQDQGNQSNPPQYIPVTASNTIKPVEKETKEKPQPSNEFSGQAGTFTDSRDGQEYKWVRISDQIWMAENLNSGMIVKGKNDQKDNGIIEKYCIKYDPYKCKIYGGFYTWNEMMLYSNGGNYHGICPNGWHVPSDEEWNKLEMFVESDTYKNYEYFQKADWRGHNTGKKLKSKEFWVTSTSNSDDFGFRVIPSGCPTCGGHEKPGKYAYFWSSTFYNNNPRKSPIMRMFSYKQNGIFRRVRIRRDLLNVRCIKDD